MVAKENEDKIEKKRKEMVILNAAAATATNFFTFFPLAFHPIIHTKLTNACSHEKVVEISF